MAKQTTQKNSNGDLQAQRRQKNSKKPMKSNITNKIKPRHSGGASPAGDSQNEDDESDSSAIGDENGAADEPDVLALSDAVRRNVDETQYLAGHKVEDEDMFGSMTCADIAQAVAGAGADMNQSEEDYADVENVSDSDESEADQDDREVLRSAEQDLIDEFERTEQRRNASSMANDLNDLDLEGSEAIARQWSFRSTGSFFGDDQVNLNEDPFFGLQNDDSLYLDMLDDAEFAIWRMPDSLRDREDSNPSSTTQKRVRFEEEDSGRSSMASSEGTEDPGEAFPDLFAAADDPAVKHQLSISHEQDVAVKQHNLVDTESFYDFEDEDEKLAFQLEEDSDSDDDMSSYDSDDEGDTTDEESREEQLARLQERKNAAGRPLNSIPSTPLSDRRITPSTASTPSTSRPVTPKDCKGPRTGTFAVDPTRAIMRSDMASNRIKLIPPSKPLEKDKEFWERARTAANSRSGSPRNSSFLAMASPSSDNMPARPFTARSTLGSMFNGNLDILRNNDDAGIASQLFPAVTGHPRSSFTTTEDSETDRQDINMQDFVDMDNSESDSDRTPSSCLASPTEPNMFSSFTSENETPDITNPGLLNHFDQCRGIVGSFRRNQHHAKQVSSLASHPAKRASTHEYNALQKGRRGAANTPITPARKKRASQDLTSTGAGIRKSLNSPLTARRPRSRGNSLAGISQAGIHQTLTRSPFE